MAKVSLRGAEDYSMSRVPDAGKKAVWKVTMVRLGGISCLPVLMLGAQLGFGMTFWESFWAVFFGSVILQVIGWLVGRIGSKEGLSTSLLARWSGFGSKGSSLIGIVLAVSLFGWFGIQNSVFAGGLLQITGVLNFPVWAIITGLGVTFIVLYGFKMMSVVANIALPLFVAGVIFAFIMMLQGHDLGVLLTMAPAGPAIPMTVAITMAAGSLMSGAVIAPDMSRFIKKPQHVFWMILISTFVGELGFCMIGSLMAHAVGSPDVVTVMYTLSGALGVGLVVFSTVKINDINLYSASLGLTNFIQALFKRNISRGMATLIMGILGTILSILGILNHFIDFLTILGVAIPPICGIMVADYYILKRSRKALDATRESGELPKTAEKWNPIAIITWVIASICGFFLTFGIGAINSLIISFALYLLLMKIYMSVSSKVGFAEEEIKIDKVEVDQE